MIAGGGYFLLVSKDRASERCRKSPLTIRFSVSILENIDPEQSDADHLSIGRFHPASGATKPRSLLGDSYSLEAEAV
jgi:hypothetical protein